MAEDLRVDETHLIPGHALSVTTARASGPGGQHVNRTESKVHLVLDLNQVYWIHGELRTRLIKLAGRSADPVAGQLAVTCQEHREQSRNLETARDRLVELVRRALVRPKRRIATKPTRGSVRRRLETKQRTATRKADRRKVEDTE